MYKGINAHNSILIGRNAQNLKNWPCRWPNRLLNFSWGASLTEWRMLKSDFNLQWIGIYPRGLSCRYYLSTKVRKILILNLFAGLWRLVTQKASLIRLYVDRPYWEAFNVDGRRCEALASCEVSIINLFYSQRSIIPSKIAKVNLDNNYTFRWEILHTHS